MDEAVNAFLAESHENLQQMEKELVLLEQRPEDRDLIASIFRTIHTIKGTCGFFAFSKLESLSHAGESLLSRLRSGEIGPTTEIGDALLALVDAVKDKLVNIEARGEEGSADDSDLIATLKMLAEPRGRNPEPSGPKAPAGRRGNGSKGEKRGASRRASGRGVKVKAKASAPRTQPVGATVEAPDPAQAVQAVIHSDSNVRVGVKTLDRLMDLVGELVLVRNRIAQIAEKQAGSDLGGAGKALDRITDELQDDVMRTRLEPLSTLLDRFPRLVRDLAAACGKRAIVEMDGGDTELDRSIIEAVKDPLVHLVRNAVDHGVEDPDVRVAAGKPPEGRITIIAFSEGGQVVIEARDDGAGIDPAAVRRRAVEMGLVAADEAARVADREALRFVFMPGFTTAKKVTSFSGRGVGMDVVRSNIEGIGGTVELASELGRGTTCRIKIPLTLAIIPALIVRNDGERFAIPQGNLLELVRLEGKQVQAGIERFKGAPVFRLREKLLPVVHLKQELAGAAVGEFAARALEREPVANVVVLQADGRRFGLVVDGVEVNEDIVVKPLGQLLKGLPLYAGATILGDGSIALILDIVGLARRTHVLSEGVERTAAGRAAVPAERGGTRRKVLFFRGPDSGRMLIPLEKVSRLEHFPVSAVERVGGREVVQYRGGILPLLRLPSPFAGEKEAGRLGAKAAAPEEIHVVVYAAEGRVVGLVVDEILDIIEEELVVDKAGAREGVVGRSVVKGRVSELLDIQGIIAATQDPLRRTGGGEGR